ncbi:MAG: PorV/PorQ family protein [Elusimicrobiota bacterium]
MVRKIGFLYLAFAGAFVLPASGLGVGTTGAQFLKVGVGARPLAMGGAFSALADDANAVNWNPGALGTVERQNVTASYNTLFRDQSQGFLGYARPIGEGKGVIGAGVNYLTVGKIEKRAGDTEDPDSTFSNQNFAVNVSYGKSNVAEGLSVGGNLKYIREVLDTYKGNAAALDFGVLYNTRIDNMSIGGSLRNLGTKIGPDPLPLTAKGGVAYKALDKKLILASDLDWLMLDRKLYWDLGGEYWINRVLAARAGYQFGRAADRLGSNLVGFAFGLGIWIEQFRLDYALVPFGDLGNTHRVTLGWSF